MKIETVKNELEKLTNDKNQIDTRIVQLREELKTLEKNSDILSGAIQTCQYLLNLEEEKPENKTKKVSTNKDKISSNI